MSNQYAIVESGVVVNMVMWDGLTDWTRPAGSTSELLPTGSPVSIGYAFNGTTFTAPIIVAPPQTLAQQAAAAMSAGLQITSTVTPALNGTYAVDQLSQMDIIAIETSLSAGKGLPGGAASFGYQDVTGAFHSFTPANFKDFAAAVRDYVYALRAFSVGTSSSLPIGSATIS